MEKIVFSVSANKKCAKEVANLLGCEEGKIQINHFQDGEVMVKTKSDVKDKIVIVIQSTSSPAHEKLFKLLLLLDSIKRGGAYKIYLYIPYFGYSRQERVSFKNEPISCEVVARILDTAKVDKIISFDIHHKDIKDFFKTEFINKPTTSLFKNYYKSILNDEINDKNNIVIVSPDHGSNERAHLLGDALKNAPVIILDKYRPAPNKAEHLKSDADVKDKTCIIVDDIIDTGGTLISASKLLKDKGAKKVLICASHAVLSKNSKKLLKSKQIADIVVTNSIEKRKIKGINYLSISPLIVDDFKD